MKFIKKYFPHILLLIYLGLLIRSWINPIDRWVRYAEEWTVLFVVIVLVATFSKFRFSNLSYFMMFLWIIIHTIGWHYTFENVPFDRFNNLFGFERNMYDRVGHFIIWFYALPIVELLDRKKWWIIKSYYIYSDSYLWYHWHDYMKYLNDGMLFILIPQHEMLFYEVKETYGMPKKIC